MPVVRIDLIKRDDPSLGRRIGEVVYAAMRETINVPDKDNFQLITEHDAAHFVFDPSYLGIERSDGMVFIHLTISEGAALSSRRHCSRPSLTASTKRPASGRKTSSSIWLR